MCKGNQSGSSIPVVHTLRVRRDRVRFPAPPTKLDFYEKEIFITKASGEKELFSDSKLRHSLEKTKAPSDVIEQIIGQIRNEVKDGTKTSEIYHYALSLLHEHNRLTAGRYALKRAVMELGPSGHPFEKLVGELFENKKGLPLKSAKQCKERASRTKLMLSRKKTTAAL